MCEQCDSRCLATKDKKNGKSEHSDIKRTAYLKKEEQN